MIRIVTLAALAAAVALPASAQSIRISTTGKTPDQVQVEVVKAAKSLCARESVGASFPVDYQRSCVKHAVRNAFKQAEAASATRLANR